MKDLNISAKDGKDGASASITVKAPETAEEAIKAFGSESVLSNSMAHWVVTLQSGVRRSIKAGNSPEMIHSKFADAKMGVAAVRSGADPIAAIKAKWPTMSAQDKKDFISDLQKS